MFPGTLSSMELCILPFFFQIFSFKQIAEHAELPGAFMIGAGAGPAHVIGVNSEVSSRSK